MYFKHNQITMYYQKEGKGKNSILILPGWGNTRETFQTIINHFKEYFTIYSLDYPGFGKSPIPETELTIYDYGKYIKEFIKENKIENPIIIAHSFGGRITSLLSYYEVPIKKIILIDVAGIKRKKKLNIFLKEIIYKFLKKIFNKNNKIKKKLFLKFSSDDYKTIPSIMRKTFQNIIQEDLRKYYKIIKQDTLIIWGGKDKDTPLKDAYLLQKMIQNSGLIVYKNGNHFSYLEKPYDTIIILKEFLKKDMD